MERPSPPQKRTKKPWVRPPLYSVWQGMNQRCRDPKAANFPYYGGRGISVCERWRGRGGYRNFLADMPPRPSPDHTLDRWPDASGDYSPDNCRWSTWFQQHETRRRGRPRMDEAKKAKAKEPRRYVLLNDRLIQAAADFAEDRVIVIYDKKVAGLRVRIGKRRISWTFYAQHQTHGRRSTTSETLGTVGAGMNVKEARAAALMIAGRNAAGRLKPGKRAAVKLSEAFGEYVAFLEAKAARRGKAPVWAASVQKLGRLYLLAEFGNWPLVDLSGSPAVVRDFHRKVTRDNGPVQANRMAQVLRAVYKHASKLNRSLPPALPTSAIMWNVEMPAEKGVDDFAAWAAAWSAIPSPVRRGFHLAQLLLGMRGGELAALRWSDIDCKARAVILRNPKGPSARPDVHLPMSVAIVHALRLARVPIDEPGGRMNRDALVFPGCAYNANRDGLPAHGHSLRHAYRSIAKAIGIDDVLARMLMGHSLGSNVSEGYLSRGMLLQPLRKAQRQISADIVRRLGLTFGRKGSS